MLNASHFLLTPSMPWSLQAGETGLLQSTGISKHVVEGDRGVLITPHFVREPLQHRRGLMAVIGAVARTSFSLIHVIGALVIGRTWAVVRGAEYVALPRMSLWLKHARPRQIIYTQGYGVVPLWFDVASRKGITTRMVFYSKNSIHIRQRGDSEDVEIPLFYYLIADRYCVWDKQQKEWLMSLGYRENTIDVVGPIIISKYPVNPGPCRTGARPRILICDRGPLKSEDMAVKGFLTPYYCGSVLREFFVDISQACEEAFPLGYELLLKANLFDHAEVAYLEAVAEFRKRHTVLMVDPYQSPLYSVDGTNAVISIPFTTVSEVGRHYGIPAIYYDPTGEIVAVPPHVGTGIPLIQGRDALVQWLRKEVH
jgi:polysaccharide biosynthesis PFTS motif protein